jgi:hypothetical protein
MKLKPKTVEIDYSITFEKPFLHFGEDGLTTIEELIEELEWAGTCYGPKAKIAIAGFDECKISVVSNEQRDEYPGADVLLES